MRVEWYGQSAFELSGSEGRVFIDPFGDVSPLAGRGLRFEYPQIQVTGVDLLLITHEHLDHNGAGAIPGEPAVVRSTAGRISTPLGDVVAVASEHDEAAGTERGPNTIFAFELDGLRVAHFGDFGQSSLREEQASVLGDIDLLFLPVGGGPTIGAKQAAEIAARLSPRWVVPMHYRTARVDFLDTADAFLGLLPTAERLEEPRFETAYLPARGGPTVVVPAVP